MNLDQLPYLSAIASTGSLSAAARLLHVSQPTLSCYLSNLEKSLGVKLFFRNRRRYIPTPAGKLYLQTADSMMEVMHHARTAIKDPPERDSLRLGLSPIWGINTLADIYPEFDNRFPHLDLKVQEGYARQLESWLRANSLDVIITTYGRTPPPGLSSIECTLSELVLAVPAFHPLAGKHAWASFEDLPIADLQDFKDSVFIMPTPASSMYEMIQELFDFHHFHPRVMTSTPHVRIQETMIRNGSRVGLLPAYCARPDPDINFFRIQNSPQMTLAFMTRSDHTLSDAERFLLFLLVRHERVCAYNTMLWSDYLREVVNEFSPSQTVDAGLQKGGAGRRGT